MKHAPRGRTLLAAAALTLLAAFAWSCTNLSNDCTLTLDCPGMPEPMCSDVLDPGPCDTCMEGWCCAELAACYTDQECLYGCLEGFYPPDPECAEPPSKVPFQAVLTCMHKSCASECAVKDTCNPVNRSGCPDKICDTSYPGIFDCYENSGTLGKLCDPCDNVNSPYCGPGLHCHPASGTCARYCCTDADCGTGRCELDPTIVFGEPLPLTKEKVGICVTQDGASAACDAPAIPPSNGSCAPQF
jgi:hypothetical protein